MQSSHDLVLVGTGFASTFFLHAYLARAPASARVLVLERGERRDHLWHLAHDAELERESQSSVVNRTPRKPWVFKLVFGGGSNCWWASTPRMLPEDFRLRSAYGVGRDWPLGYDELEESYCLAEELMSVAGPSQSTPFPRSRPYPLPPHRLSDPDRLFQARFPEHFFVQPSARPTRTLSSGRPRCCASGVCNLCPIDSKFTVLNSMHALYLDPRVELRTGACVEALEFGAGTVAGVRYRAGGREELARADLVGLGANALFNAHILQRSGLRDPELGQGLVEQVPAAVDVLLDGVDNFQGSTSMTGHGYMLYGGEHRRERAAALMETWNVPELRDERGKWRQRLILKFVYEDLREPRNRVAPSAEDPSRPEVRFEGHSDYAERGRRSLEGELQEVLGALPVERYTLHLPARATESHILGTTVMGADPASSVVDRDLVHHRLRNLLVLGGSVFPTAAPANPTLTLCALSLRAAERLLGGR